MLESMRVLDLTDHKGFLCGRILADLGADVIKVEAPGGDISRHFGPFYKDINEPEKSLFWFAYNMNKRGITLDIASDRGRDIFMTLTKNVDCIIESNNPGYMDNLDIGYRTVSKTNPGVIFTSITPFGQTGPYMNYRGCDMVVAAMSGQMYMIGDNDHQPVQICPPHACFHAGADAAVGTLIAYYNREMTGQGQHVDISMQQSLSLATQNAVPMWELSGVITNRHGSFRSGLSMNITQRSVWPCKDGFVNFTILGGPAGAKTNRALVEWMDSEGRAPEFLKNFDWDKLDMVKITQEMLVTFENPIAEFFMTHSMTELYGNAIAKQIMLYPVLGAKDIVENVQLSDREYWLQINHPELGQSIKYPGYFAKTSENMCTTWRRAPLIGEHNQEIYQKELGLSSKQIQLLKQDNII